MFAFTEAHQCRCARAISFWPGNVSARSTGQSLCWLRRVNLPICPDLLGAAKSKRAAWAWFSTSRSARFSADLPGGNGSASQPADKDGSLDLSPKTQHKQGSKSEIVGGQVLGLLFLFLAKVFFAFPPAWVWLKVLKITIINKVFQRGSASLLRPGNRPLSDAAAASV